MQSTSSEGLKGPEKKQQEGEKKQQDGEEKQQEGEKKMQMGATGDKTERQVPESGDAVASSQRQKEQETRGGEGREEEDEQEKAETAMLEAAAAMSMAPEEDVRKESDNLDIYNKGLTSLMTFDESGHPILVPVSDAAATAAGRELLPTSSTAAASDDTEGQYEAVPPPKGPCAGLCPPYGALPEQMPLLGTGREKQAGVAVSEAVTKTGIDLAVAEAEAAGEEVEQEDGEYFIRKRKGRSISIYSLPSRNLVFPLPREISCPVPLWQHLPLSPFINRNGEVGVDVCVIAEDLGAADYRDAIPTYDFDTVTQAAAAAGHDLQPPDQQAIDRISKDQNYLRRLDTLKRSSRQPVEIALD